MKHISDANRMWFIMACYMMHIVADNLEVIHYGEHNGLAKWSYTYVQTLSMCTPINCWPGASLHSLILETRGTTVFGRGKTELRGATVSERLLWCYHG